MNLKERKKIKNCQTDYLKKLRKRDMELGNYLGTNCPQVEMITNMGKSVITGQNFLPKARN